LACRLGLETGLGRLRALLRLRPTMIVGCGYGNYGYGHNCGPGTIRGTPNTFILQLQLRETFAVLPWCWVAVMQPIRQQLWIRKFITAATGGRVFDGISPTAILDDAQEFT
jgi:hypothetical protein